MGFQFIGQEQIDNNGAPVKTKSSGFNFIGRGGIPQETVKQDMFKTTPVRSNPDDFNFQLYPHMNPEEIRAQRQSTGEKWANASGKMLGLAGTTFLDGTIGTVAGLGNLAVDAIQGDIHSGKHALDSFVRNPFSEYMQEINQKMEVALPNYYTQYEQESPWYKRMGMNGGANFWADTIFKNFGFALGAMGSGMLYGAGVAKGLSAAGKGVELQKSVARRVAKQLGITEAHAIEKMAKGQIQASQLTAELAKDAQTLRTGKHLQELTASTMGAVGESRIEAINTYNEVFDKLKLENPLMSESEINEHAITASNMVFGLDMITLSVGNYTQFKNAFSRGYNINDNSLNAIRRNAKTGLYEADGAKLQLAKDVLKVAKNPLTEGLEEQQQYANQLMGEKFAELQNDPESQGTFDDIVQSGLHGIVESYGDIDTYENFFAGAMVGSVGMPRFGGKFGIEGIEGGIYGGVREAKADRVKTAAAVEAINKYTGKENFKNIAKMITRDMTLEQIKTDALINGDIYNFKNAESDQMINMVLAYEQAGKLTDLADDIKRMATMDPAEYRKSMLIDKAKLPKKIQDEISDKNATGDAKLPGTAQEQYDPFHNRPDKIADEIPGTPDNPPLASLERILQHNSKRILEEINKVARIKQDLDTKSGGRLPQEIIESLVHKMATIQNVEDRLESVRNVVSQIPLKTPMTTVDSTDIPELDADGKPQKSTKKSAKGTIPGKGQLSGIPLWDLSQLNEGNEKEFIASFNEYAKENPVEADKVRKEVVDAVKLSQRRREFVELYRSSFQDGKPTTSELERMEKRLLNVNKLVREKKLKPFTKNSIITRRNPKTGELETLKILEVNGSKYKMASKFAVNSKFPAGTSEKQFKSNQRRASKGLPVVENTDGDIIEVTADELLDDKNSYKLIHSVDPNYEIDTNQISKEPISDTTYTGSAPKDASQADKNAARELAESKLGVTERLILHALRGSMGPGNEYGVKFDVKKALKHLSKVLGEDQFSIIDKNQLKRITTLFNDYYIKHLYTYKGILEFIDLVKEYIPNDQVSSELVGLLQGRIESVRKMKENIIDEYTFAIAEEYKKIEDLTKEEQRAANSVSETLTKIDALLKNKDTKLGELEKATDGLRVERNRLEAELKRRTEHLAHLTRRREELTSRISTLESMKSKVEKDVSTISLKNVLKSLDSMASSMLDINELPEDLIQGTPSLEDLVLISKGLQEEIKNHKDILEGGSLLIDAIDNQIKALDNYIRRLRRTKDIDPIMLLLQVEAAIENKVELRKLKKDLIASPDLVRQRLSSLMAKYAIVTELSARKELEEIIALLQPAQENIERMHAAAKDAVKRAKSDVKPAASVPDDTSVNPEGGVLQSSAEGSLEALKELEAMGKLGTAGTAKRSPWSYLAWTAGSDRPDGDPNNNASQRRWYRWLEWKGVDSDTIELRPILAKDVASKLPQDEFDTSKLQEETIVVALVDKTTGKFVSAEGGFTDVFDPRLSIYTVLPEPTKATDAYGSKFYDPAQMDEEQLTFMYSENLITKQPFKTLDERREYAIRMVEEHRLDYEHFKKGLIGRLVSGEKFTLPITGVSGGVPQLVPFTTVAPMDFFKGSSLDDLEVKVSTTGYIKVGTDKRSTDGYYVKVPKGYTYIWDKRTGNHIVLNPRTLTQSEMDTVVNILSVYASRQEYNPNTRKVTPRGFAANAYVETSEGVKLSTDDINLFKILNSIVFWTHNNNRNTKDGSIINKNESTRFHFVDNSGFPGGEIQVGEQAMPLLDLAALDEGVSRINPELVSYLREQFLPKIHRQINSTLLHSESPKVHVHGVDAQGRINKTTSRPMTYKEYILDNTESEAIVSISVPLRDEPVTIDDFNSFDAQPRFVNKYVGYVVPRRPGSPISGNVTAPQVNIPVAAPAEFEGSSGGLGGDTSDDELAGISGMILGGNGQGNAKVVGTSLVQTVIPGAIPPTEDDGGNPFIDDDRAGLNERRANGFTKAENTEASKKWFKARFPNVDYVVVDRLINGRSWGSFKDALVTVMNGAEEGTTYHEAFHVVFNLFLTKTEQDALLAEFMSRGDAEEVLARSLYKDRPRKIQIEEALADEFMEYELSGGTKPIPQPKKKSFFRRLLEFFNIFKDTATIAEVYSRLSNGYYAGKSYSQDYTGGEKDRRVEDRSEAWVDNLMKVTDYYFLSYMNDSKYRDRFDRITRGYEDTRLVNLAYNDVLRQVTDRVSGLNRQIAETLPRLEVFKGKITATTPVRELSDYQQATRKLALMQHQANNLQWIIDNFEENQSYTGIDRQIKSVKGIHLLQHLPKYKFEPVDIDSIKSESAKDSASNTWAQNEMSVSSQRSSSNRMKLLIASIPNTGKATKDSPVIKGYLASAEERNSLTDVPEGDAYILQSNKIMYVKTATGWENQGLPPYLTRSVNSEFGMFESVDFLKTFNSLVNGLAGVRNMTEMLDRMERLKPITPGMHYLLNSLKLRDIIEGKAVRQSDLAIAMEFFQTFAKQNIDYKQSIIHENGISVLIDSSDETLKARILQKWKNNKVVFSQSAKYKHLYTLSDSGVIIYNGKNPAWNTFDLKTRDGKLEFLKVLGIDIEPYIAKQLSDNGDVLNYNTLRVWRDRITATGDMRPIMDVLSKEAEEKPALTRIIDELASYSPDMIENSHRNIDGEQVYDKTMNTYVSTIKDTINNIKNKEELFLKLPHLDTAYVRNSKVLSRFFYADGKRNKIPFNLFINEGQITSDQSTRKPFISLSPGDKLRAIINGAAVGNYVMLRPSDNSSERFFNFGEPIITRDDALLNSSLAPFVGYVEDELRFLNTIFQGDITFRNAAKSLDFETAVNNSPLLGLLAKNASMKASMQTLFTPENIVLGRSSELMTGISKFMEDNASGIRSIIGQHMNDSTEILMRVAEKHGLISKVEGSEDYFNYGLEFTVDGVVTKEAIEAYLYKANINFQAGQIEQTKLLYGHPSSYKNIDNMLKRMSGAIGPKKVSITDHTISKLIETFYPPLKRKGTIYKKYQDGTLIETDVNDVDGRPVLRTAVMSDVMVSSVLREYASQYDNINEADAQGIIDLEEYRQILIRSAAWTQDLEKLFQWEIQREDNTFIDRVTYTWDGKTHTITEADLMDSKGKRIVFNPLKPQHFGPLAHNGFFPGMYKLSVYPLIPSMTSHSINGININRRLNRLKTFMRSNNIGIVTFESASKGEVVVSNDKGALKANELYTSEGKLNVTTPVFQDTWYEYWGIQVETGFTTKTEGPNGTQLAKHIMAELLSDGVYRPLTINGKTGADVTKGAVDEYIRLNESRIDMGKRKLIRRFGLVEQGGRYVVNKPLLLKAALKRELLKRDNPSSYVDAVDFVVDNISRSPMGVALHVSRATLEPMLTSMANKDTIGRNRTGGAKIQAASTLFENELNLRAIKTIIDPITGKTRRVAESNDLQFYKGNGTTKTNSIEVYLPHMFKGLGDGRIFIINGKYMLDGEKELDPRLFKILGFRIPTSGLNSADSIIIKGFLPQSCGDMIVLPSDIVAKAGSDYDVDKMQIYSPNYQIITERRRDADGNEIIEIVDIKYIEYYGAGLALDPSISKLMFDRVKRDIANENADLSSRLEILQVSFEKAAFNKGVIGRKSVIGRFKSKNKEAFETALENMDVSIINKAKDSSTLNELKEIFSDIQNELTVLRFIKDEIENVDDVNSLAEEMVSKFFFSTESVKDLISNGRTVAEFMDAITARRTALIELDKLFSAKTDATGRNIFQKDKAAVEALEALKADYYSQRDGLINDYARPIFDQMTLDEKNGFKATENRLNAIMDDILTAPENFHNLIRPISTTRLKDIANDINILRNNSRSQSFTDMLSLEYILDATERYLNGMMGVGISAVQATNHILANQANWKISATSNVTFRNFFYPTTKNFPKDIPREQKLYTNVNLPHTNGAGYSPVLNKFITTAGDNIADIFNQFINAYVDVATDPFIIDLHAGPETASTIMLLIRAGVPVETAFLFMNQPIIRDFIEMRVRNNKAVMAKANNGLFLSEGDIISELVDKYGGSFVLNRKQTFTDQTLRSYISNDNIIKEEFNMDQIQILSDFLRYESMASHMRTAASSMNMDTNGIPMDEASFIVAKAKKDLARNEGFVINYDKMIEEGAFLSGYEKAVDEVSLILAPMFTVSKLPAVRVWATEFAKMLLHKGYVGNDTIVQVVSRFISNFTEYAVTSTPFKMNMLRNEYGDSPTQLSLEQEVESLMMGNTSVARLLRTIQDEAHPALRDNKIIESLNTNIRQIGSISNVSMFKQNMDAQEKESLINDWRDLLTMPGHVGGVPIRKFAVDLAKVAILQDGLKKTRYSYTDIIPPELYFDIVFNASQAFFNYGSEEELNGRMEQFVKKFYSNAYNLRELIPTAKPNKDTGSVYGQGKGLPIVQTRQLKAEFQTGVDIKKRIEAAKRNFGVRYLFNPVPVLMRDFSNPIIKGAPKLTELLQSHGAPAVNSIQDDATRLFLWSRDIKTLNIIGYSSLRANQSPEGDTSILTERIDISNSTKKSPYFEKDKTKFADANKLIARGSKDSSSEAYRIAVGNKANTGNYNSNDIVAISAEGNRVGRVKPDYVELEKAVNANVTFITDNDRDRKRDYNIGEREVANYLTSKGFSESGNGVWTRQANITRTEDGDINFKWARTAENSYEVSTQGDKRFSALFAKLKDGRTIEEAYQLDVKGYRSQGNDWKLGKGKAPLKNISKEQTWSQYKELWNQFLNENPVLEQDLLSKASGKVLTDKFASTDISQARALAELLNERNSISNITRPEDGDVIKDINCKTK